MTVGRATAPHPGRPTVREQPWYRRGFIAGLRGHGGRRVRRDPQNTGPQTRPRWTTSFGGAALNSRGCLMSNQVAQNTGFGPHRDGSTSLCDVNRVKKSGRVHEPALPSPTICGLSAKKPLTITAVRSAAFPACSSKRGRGGELGGLHLASAFGPARTAQCPVADARRRFVELRRGGRRIERAQHTGSMGRLG